MPRMEGRKWTEEDNLLGLVLLSNMDALQHWLPLCVLLFVLTTGDSARDHAKDLLLSLSS